MAEIQLTGSFVSIDDSNITTSKSSVQQLIDYRKVFALLSLVLAALCSPPDVFSQLILAIPIILFYESLLFFLILKKHYKNYL